MKGMFKVTTRTIVAIGIGAAIFTLLFMYVKIPSPVPDTSVQTAYGFQRYVCHPLWAYRRLPDLIHRPCPE